MYPTQVKRELVENFKKYNADHYHNLVKVLNYKANIMCNIIHKCTS